MQLVSTQQIAGLSPAELTTFLKGTHMDCRLEIGQSEIGTFFVLFYAGTRYIWDYYIVESDEQPEHWSWMEWPKNWETCPTYPSNKTTFLVITGRELDKTIEEIL